MNSELETLKIKYEALLRGKLPEHLHEIVRARNESLEAENKAIQAKLDKAEKDLSVALNVMIDAHDAFVQIHEYENTVAVETTMTKLIVAMDLISGRKINPVQSKSGET